MEKPLHPHITVHLSEQKDRPVASIALVRRALQKAGHGEDALKFSREAMAGEIEDIWPIARKYVTLR